MNTKRFLPYFIFLLYITFVLSSKNVFAISTPPINQFQVKELKDVYTGIDKQLDYLLATNKQNQLQGTPEKNWYVYIIGNDTFNPETPNYLDQDLDLSQIGTSNSPVSITELNQSLVDVNTKLAQEGKPLIYYGVANKKTIIVAPFFPFELQHKASDLSLDELIKYYSNTPFSKVPEFSKMNSLLTHFNDTELVTKSNQLFDKAIAKSKGANIIAISKIYFAFVKIDSNGSPVLKWYAQTNYKENGSYFDKNPIDDTLVQSHIKSQINSSLSANQKTINAWYNYLTNKEVLNPVNIKGVDQTFACLKLQSPDATKQLEQLREVLKTKTNIELIKIQVNQTCISVLKDLSYTEIISIIKTIASETIAEKQEADILRLIHSIKFENYDAFFADLKFSNNQLMTRLLDEMDNEILGLYGENNYTSFINELLYIGGQKQNTYLKKERLYIYKTLLEHADKGLGADKFGAMASTLSYNLDVSETEFETFLIANDYNNLKSILRFFASSDGEVSHPEEFKILGDNLGKFFSKRNNQKVYIELLEIAFYGKILPYKINLSFRSEVANMVYRMMANVPQDTNQLYDYFEANDFKKLKYITQQTAGKNHQLYTASFYKGITQILNNKQNINARITLIKWALDENNMFSSAYESMMLNLIKNINTTTDKEVLIRFFNDNNLEYFKKCVVEKGLKSNDLLTEFISEYARLLSDAGTVDQRIKALNVALEIKENDIISKDQEIIVSHLFDHIKQGEQLQQIVDRLKASDYALFAKVWFVLSEAGMFEWFNTDNEYATNFVTQLSTILSQIHIKVNLPESLQKYLISNVNYFNGKTSEIPIIDINKDRFFILKKNNTDQQKLAYKLESEIIIENNTANVYVDVTLDNFYTNEINLIKTKTLKPFDFVYIQFAEDLNIAGKNHLKGNIIIMPAMYIPWLSYSFDSQFNSMITSVMIEAIAIAAAIPTAGTSLSLLTATEIIFSAGNIIIELNKDNIDQSEYATKAKDLFGNTELIFGIVSSPFSFNNAVRLAPTPTSNIKEILDLKSQFGTAKSTLKNIQSFEGFKILMDNELITKSIQKIKENTPDEFKRLYQIAKDQLANQKITLDLMPTSNSGTYRTLYNQNLELVKTFKRFANTSQYSADKIAQLNGFSDNIGQILVKENINLEYFRRLTQISFEMLTPADQKLINRIRDAIPLPDSNTLLTKVIPTKEIEKYMDGTYTQIGGFIATANDSKHLKTYEDIINGLRLDYNKSSHYLASNYYGIIRYKVDNVKSIHVPKCIQNGGKEAAEYPYTGAGFTAGTAGKLGTPELKSDYLSPKDGAELWKVFSDGSGEELVAIYSAIDKRFHPVN